jgi:hypothetical protein
MLPYLLSALLTITPLPPADAQTPPTSSPSSSSPQPTAAEIEELRRRLDVLAREVEQLRSGEEQEPELSEVQRRAAGVAPSAAAVYRKKQGVSFAGYGEAVYQNSEQVAARFDLLRAVLYAGYRFNDRFLFNSEVEFEHGGEEVGVEFAYLDYRVRNDLTLRGGLVLLPMGLINEFHEPTVFLGALRPETERRILPATWRENGFGVLGARGPVSYRAYAVTGMNAEGFSASGIRGGRQNGIEALAEDFAFVGRVDVTPVNGVFVGGSLYAGNSGQKQFADVNVGTTIGEVHGQAQIRGWDARALYARVSLDDVAALNAARDLTGPSAIPGTMQGGYAQLGYNVLNTRSTSVALTPFFRFERVSTATSADYRTLGVELRPTTGVVVKTDYQWLSGSGRNQFNVALGYAF